VRRSGVEILLLNENLWLTQTKMDELFDEQKVAISKLLKNIFENGELQESSVVSKMETTASDGKNYRQGRLRKLYGIQNSRRFLVEGRT